MKKPIIFALMFISVHLLAAQPSFIKKVNDSDHQYTGTSNLLYYTSQNGDSLWRSNGTAAGTYVIKTGLINVSNLTPVGNKIYFIAEGVTGYDLSVSDGTTPGTFPFANFTEISSLTAFGTQLFFIAQTASGRELWKTDGTIPGTVMVKDINPGAADGLVYRAELEVANGILYFPANNGTQGVELWKSNGTTAGTLLVKDIVAGIGSSSPYGLSDAGTQLIFLVGRPSATIWKSNGTSAGTLAVEAIPYDVSDVGESVTMGGVVYFTIFGSYVGGLWKSNGTAAGTMEIYGGWPEVIVPYNVNGTLAFTVNNHEHWNLYKSNGMPGGETNVDEGYWSHELVVIGKYLFYTEDAGDYYVDETHPDELWQTDLTPAGTRMIKDLYSELDTTFALSAGLAAVGNTLYFTSENNGTDMNSTINLWKLVPQDRLVTSLTLVNSVTDTDIRTLEEGDTIYTDQRVNIRANTFGSVGSVKFFVNDSPFSLENTAPYALAGDNSGNYLEWMKPTGLVEITAVPYAGDGASGAAGPAFSLNVRIIAPSDTVTSSDISFTLVNAVSDTDIGPLVNGQVIDLATLPTNRLNVRANSSFPMTESVVFDYNGVTAYQVENTAPYALFGDVSGNYDQWYVATPGTYTLRATPYTANNGAGTAGDPLFITFTIVNSGSLRLAYTYPNPADDQVVVSLSNDLTQEVDVQITDLKGRAYYSGKLNSVNGNLSIDLISADLSAGIYLIMVNKGTDVEVIKMVKK